MADSDKLGLGLDDIIRNDRTLNRRGGRGGVGAGRRGFRARGVGSARVGGQSNGFRTRGGGGLPRTSNAPAGRWKHDLFEDNTTQARGAQRTSGVNSTTKLLISNLDFGVTTADIEELFEDVGAVRVARVHYDESGRSLGTGEVVFERRVDAVNALQKYNGLNLDDRPMDIRLVGGVSDGANANGTGGGNQRSGFRNNNQQQNGNRGGANRSRGGKQQQQQQQNGFGNNKNKKEKVTTEDLDADLEAYRAENAPKK